MITPEMYQAFDWSTTRRRTYYADLLQSLATMQELMTVLTKRNLVNGFIDLSIIDRFGEICIPLTGPGISDSPPTQPRRDDALIEYLAEWAAGVGYHAAGEIADMDQRYPELRSLGARLLVLSKPQKKLGLWKRLKRRLRAIFS